MNGQTRRLVLEERSRTPDGAGGFTGSWAALGVLWGAVAPSGGRIAAGEGGALSRAGYRITVRAAPPESAARPRAGQRFREGTRLYRIRAVTQAADARWLTCLADEEAWA